MLISSPEPGQERNAKPSPPQEALRAVGEWKDRPGQPGTAARSVSAAAPACRTLATPGPGTLAGWAAAALCPSGALRRAAALSERMGSGPGARWPGTSRGCGSSRAQRFSSRWGSPGGRDRPHLCVCHPHGPACSGAESTSRFLPRLVSAPFATGDAPRPVHTTGTTTVSPHPHPHPRPTLLLTPKSSLLCGSLRHSNQTACLPAAPPLPASENSHPLRQ